MTFSTSRDLVLLRADRWVSLLAWLSLDAVRSLWGSVGFRPDSGDQETLIALLRRAILRVARANWASRRAPSTFITDVLQAVASEHGEAAHLSLVRFGRFTFAMGPDDHPELFAWEEIVARCATDPVRLGILVPWEPLRAPIAEEIRRACAAVVRKELAMPLSSWDLAVFALRGIDDADPLAREHPMRLAEFTSRVANARTLWRSLLPLLDCDRRDALAWNATRLGWSLGVLPRHASLPDPATLIEAEHE